MLEVHSLLSETVDCRPKRKIGVYIYNIVRIYHTMRMILLYFHLSANFWSNFRGSHSVRRIPCVLHGNTVQHRHNKYRRRPLYLFLWATLTSNRSRVLYSIPISDTSILPSSSKISLNWPYLREFWWFNRSRLMCLPCTRGNFLIYLLFSFFSLKASAT